MMFFKSIILVALCTGLSYGDVYDYYTGKKCSKCLLAYYEKYNLTDTCTIDVEPCDPEEWSRVDGSCNNLEYPASGTFFEPPRRILPAHFHEGYKPRLAISGAELPPPRHVRLHLLGEAISSHHLFNHNVGGYGIYKFNDIGSVHDSENLLMKTTFCCQKEHMNDKACTPNILEDDDPVMRYSSIRCMNSTRPLSYQDFGCTKDSVPAMLKKATTFHDESQIYNSNGEGDKVIRSFKNGMLKVEEEDGKFYPPNGPNGFCPNNQGPEETRCFENYKNTLLPITLFNTWFVRYHNYIARELAEVNPCWDDEMLFYTARDINIACSNEMFFYEWGSVVQGEENLLKAGVKTKHNGFRNLYDPKKKPTVTLEYTYLMRWFHIMQEDRAKLYDKHGNYLKDFPLLNTTFRIGLVLKDEEFFTQSTFRAPCHGLDGTIAYDVANNGFPGVQLALDIPAGDLNKGRNFGLAPYIDYIYHFTGVNITCFEDLKPFIHEKYIEIMKDLYEDVRDIDLMAGMWCSKVMEGGNIPALLASILNDNWYRAVTTDRFWYENPNRPHPMTSPQLMEIRKSSVSQLMCAVGDGVSEIPKNGFLKISKKNPLVPCCQIPKIDFSAWADDACNTELKQCS